MANSTILVKFAPDISTVSAEAFVQRQGLKVKKRFPNISREKGCIYLSVIPANEIPVSGSKITMLVRELAGVLSDEFALKTATIQALTQELTNTPEIERADLNYRAYAISMYKHNQHRKKAAGSSSLAPNRVPNDPLYPQLWGMSNMGVQAAWEHATGSEDTVIFVLDTGIDTDHQDLVGNLWVNLGEGATPDGIDNDNNGYIDDIHGIDTLNNDSDPEDDRGHGTHVAGIIAAQGNNAAGVVGVNWNAKIGACKFLADEGTIEGAVQCFDYVLGLKNAGMNIVATNNSWGDDEEGAQGDILNDAIGVNIAAGILPVISAGNYSSDIDGSASVFPCKYTYPDMDGDSICVTAINESNERPAFACYGAASVDLAAPGVNILSTVPTFITSDMYASGSGTSMAAPHVTGLAALAAAYCRGKDLNAIRSAILNGAVPVDSLTGFTVTGAKVNAHNTLELLCAEQKANLSPILNLLLR